MNEEEAIENPEFQQKYSQAFSPEKEPSTNKLIVKFDAHTNDPFNVLFSERGFEIEGTRLSFETIENALSKNFYIILKNGKGTYLDAVRMQKILNYKNLYESYRKKIKKSLIKEMFK